MNTMSRDSTNEWSSLFLDLRSRSQKQRAVSVTVAMTVSATDTAVATTLTPLTIYLRRYGRPA